jgi:hypothetical protein
MLLQALLVAHIVVLGYWLGSELVINSTYRYVSWSSGMPFAERERLMDHVMDVDQHVRYALVLQAGLGTALAALYGFFPGGVPLVIGAAVATVCWLALVEATHRLRRTDAGRRLAAFDRRIRYALAAFFLALGLAALGGSVPALPNWLGWKLLAFAGVVACGVGIRFALMAFYRTWEEMAREGTNQERERAIRATYVRATSLLGLLWLFIAVITALSLLKPG